MKSHNLFLGLVLSFFVVTVPAAELFVSPGGSHVAPFSDWASAATNIQSAIDAATTGDIVTVTNGVYAQGGKVKAGNLTNRIAVDKPILVRSVNGPGVTIVQGAWDLLTTNGPGAVRCAWLTNGATLSGFTLRGGATRAVSISGGDEMMGGGLFGTSTNAMASDCRVDMNCAAFFGGGAFRMTLNGCRLTGNRAIGSGTPGAGIAGAGSGGGAYGCNLNQCLLTSNEAVQSYGGGVYSSLAKNCALVSNAGVFGGAAYSATLINCTVTGNTSGGYSGSGSAVHSASLTNCLVWGNLQRTANANTNHANCTFAYSDSYPLPAGVGNISADPQLLGDGYHLLQTSPCRGAGTNLVSGTDLDGQVWNNPPAIGCDEWSATPLMLLAPQVLPGARGRTQISALAAAGQEPMAYYWLRDGLVLAGANYAGTDSNNLLIIQLGPGDAGSYQVVASNAFGMATSAVATVAVRCVNIAGTSPAAPYTDWTSAATNIQTAVDVSAIGDIVLVTNGIYTTGGKVKSGDLLNRVAIDKPITVIGVNGYQNTTIEGAWDPVSTNGPLAVRGVWMSSGAKLIGFTVRNGATRGGNSLTFEQQCGGGIWAESTVTAVLNCLITNNAARWIGGGTYYGTFINCILTGNTVDALGVPAGGGAAGYANLRNCTVSGNRSARSSSGGGTLFGSVRNCIVINNSSGFSLFNVDNFYNISGSVDYAYTCTDPLPGGAGNIKAYPVFLDESFHLPAQSACRAVGSASFASGEDMDGEAWANPPSMGADEMIEPNLIGPIQLTINAATTNTLPGMYHSVYFRDSIIGRVSRIDWDFGDGMVLTNTNFYANHWWTNPGNYTVTSTAFNNDYPGGIAASIVVQVLPLIQPVLQNASLAANGFKFSFEAQGDGYYVLQYATNLVAPVTWQALQYFPFTPAGTITITDPVWTNSARFYRVLAQ